MVRLPDAGAPLAKDNRFILEADSQDQTGLDPYKSLLALVADVLDSAADGNDSFVSIGTTRNKSAFTIMVQIAGRRHSLYAENLGALSDQAQTLL
ncbi:MAG: hypothetical protein [Circular genetic element sp.]|nr:MAG: hypothetical protein [Circular genetic element sp.]